MKRHVKLQISHVSEFMSYCDSCVCLQGCGQFYMGVEEAINGGCLPCKGELESMVRSGKFWACHDSEDSGNPKPAICQGAISYARKIGVEIPEHANIGQLFDYTQEAGNNL